MLRVTTLYASSAGATADYYTRYLTGAPGEVPGVWSGRQAAAFGLSGTVDTESLKRLLEGRDPVSGTRLGRELVDRVTADGREIQAVSGFDATFSAPKSVSVLWGLTGDERFLQAHDVAVAAALAHLERWGSTTRIRCNGGRLHPDTNGSTFGSFRQTTSRDDDPQIHTHAVISAKVQTADGRWLALDAHYLKLKQRVLGVLYQSVLRSELTHRLGVEWGPIVNGQAEIAGFPAELVTVFSKRAAEIDDALTAKIGEFRQRNGRAPTRFERAALEREASADTRGRKSGLGADQLADRWHTDAADAGWTVERLVEGVGRAGLDRSPVDSLTVADVVEAVSMARSSWGRPEVVQAICDLQRPLSQLSGQRWARAIEQAADHVLERCVDLDPPGVTRRRESDGRSLWIEPTAPRYTSDAVLTEEEHIITWAIDAQTGPPTPSATVNRAGLDVLQADAAAAVAGEDRVVLVVGPAGSGKTRMLAAAVDDLHDQRRPLFGVAPTAKAARVLEPDTGMRADTVAKLLHEWQRSDRPPLPAFQLDRGTTLVVDEAGMLSTPALRQLVTLADANRWRLVLVGDHRQLQAVGRFGLFAELCGNGRVDHLERLHRFTLRWEAAASLLLRSGDPGALDAYEAHDRIIPGTLADHLGSISDTWITHHRHGSSLAVVASTNDHVDLINKAVQTARLAAGDLDGETATPIAASEWAHVGDVVATRRNDRSLVTSTGEIVRNRETWTVTTIGGDGSLTVSHLAGRGTVTLPADYVREHVRLGYAATEHGWQSDTVDHAIALVSASTTRRGLYVAATRGRDTNVFCVVTDSDEVAEARDVLEAILAIDRADIPAVTQRRTLAHQTDRRQPSQRPAMPRCAIPEWFEPLLAQARAELATANARHAERESERQPLLEAVAVAERELARLETATAAAREALASATRRVAEARRQYDAAQVRLDATGVRGRRQARRDLVVAERHLEQANEYLGGVRRRNIPHVDRYQLARAGGEPARSDLDRHDFRCRLDHIGDRVAVLQRRVGALDTWRRWAGGEPIDIKQLSNAIEQLTGDSRRGNHASHFRALAQAAHDWAGDAGIDLPTPARRFPTVERVGPELGP